MYSMEKFTGLDSSASGWEKEGRCFALRDNYKKKVKEISQAWNQVHRMKRLAVGLMTTPEYSEWRSKRINDNIPELNGRVPTSDPIRVGDYKTRF
ncbi:hypothetical protein Gotur_027783 [Gossypium turneri]